MGAIQNTFNERSVRNNHNILMTAKEARRLAKKEKEKEIENLEKPYVDVLFAIYRMIEDACNQGKREAEFSYQFCNNLKGLTGFDVRCEQDIKKVLELKGFKFFNKIEYNPLGKPIAKKYIRW